MLCSYNMLDVRLSTDNKHWDSWLHQRDVPPFTQSSAWADILVKENKTVELVEFRNDNAKVAQALLIFNTLPFGWRYAFCPRGPVVANDEEEAEVYDSLADYCKQKKCLFLRIEPAHSPVLPNAIKAIDINPRATVLLDLQQPLEKMLDAMHQKTRYNIRLAEKKELTVSDTKNTMFLLDLLFMTGKRDGFSLHDREHYEEILKSPLSAQLTVLLGQKPIATAVFVGCGNTYTYLYGASDYEHRSLMSPYVLQWAAIKHGQQKGYRWYDFFGIAPVTVDNGNYVYDEKHQYAGVTRFKLGFGGVVTEAPGTYDLIISPFQYRMYGLLRRFRRKF